MQGLGGPTSGSRPSALTAVAPGPSPSAPAATPPATQDSVMVAGGAPPVQPLHSVPAAGAECTLGTSGSMVGGSVGHTLSTTLPALPLTASAPSSLAPAVQALASGLLAGERADSVHRHLDRLVTSPVFARLDESVQGLALKCLAYIDRAEGQAVRDASRSVLAERGLQTEGDGRLHVTAIATLEGFTRLSLQEQKKLLISMCGGGTPHVLLTMLAEKKLATLPTDAQAATLAQLARDLPLPTRLEEPPRISMEGKTILDYGEMAYAVPTPDGRQVRCAGHAYGVTVGDQVIPVMVPAQEPPAQGVRYPSLLQVMRALRALPDELRQGVEAVTVMPTRKASKAGLDGGALADSGSGGVPGLIRFFASADWDQALIDGTMVHEAGHVRTNALWGREGRTFKDDTSSPGWTAWRKAMEDDGIAASGYARVAPTEDFSETLRATFLVLGTPLEDELRALMPHRAALLDAVVPSWGRGLSGPSDHGGLPARTPDDVGKEQRAG